ncbi:MAG: hypothetical protein HC877_21050 [Thioploca sp.]|nr:hypothetical protein [Thioploca sp.]
MPSNLLSNLQIELLKLYSTDLPEPELIELKILLANYFAQKAIQGADRIWEEKPLFSHDMETWLNE